MDSDFDLSSAIEQIQNMMNTDDGQAKLNNIINAFTAGPDEPQANAAPDGFGTGGALGLDQMDLMIKLGGILSSVKEQENGKSAKLLYAIKPYLKKSRQDKTDGAIKIMGMVKAFALLKDSGINLNF